MLSLFANTHLSTLLAVTIYALLLKLHLFIDIPTPTSHGCGPFGQWTIDGLREAAKWPGEFIVPVASLLLIFFQALMVNRLVNNFKIVGKQTYLPAAFYILFSSLFTGFGTVSPLLLAMTFVLWAMLRVHGVYGTERCDSNIFDTGLLCAIASLFYPPALVLVASMVFALASLRPINVRELAVFFVGLGLPFYLTAVWFFWNDGLVEFLNETLVEIWALPAILVSASVENAVKIGLASLWMFLAFAAISTHYMNSAIQVRKYLDIQLAFFFLAGLSVLAVGEFTLSALFILSTPVAVLFSYQYLHSSKKIVAEMLHLLMIASIFFFHYFNAEAS